MAIFENTPFELGDDVAKRLASDDVKSERVRSIVNFELSTITGELSDDLLRTGRSYSCEQAYPLMFNFGKCDLRLSQRLEVEFKRFCILTIIYPDVPHAPPGAVDMYWHFFILHTKSYIGFCETVWGDVDGDPRIRHHYPSTDETRRGMLNAYKETRALYIELFGEPKPFELEGIRRSNGEVLPLAAREIWSHASDTSGDSYSGTVEADELAAH